MKVIINVGISGSGKSTWTTNFIKNLNFLRINRDDIRKVCVGDLKDYYKRPDVNNIETHIISIIEYDLFINYLEMNINCIIDNTNLKKEYIKKWIDLCEDHDIEYQFKLFDCDLNIAKERVLLRDFPHLITFDTGIQHFSNILELNYIDKQYENYNNIKKWILENYEDKII